jgi:hypothetical protein
VYPTGKIGDLQLMQNTAHYLADPGQRISGLTIYGGSPGSLDFSVINEKFQNVYNNSHSPQLYIGQGSQAIAVVCSVDVQSQVICANSLSGGGNWGRVSTWIGLQGSFSLGMDVGTVRTTSGGCPRNKDLALYCRTPDSIQICSDGEDISSPYYPIDTIPCNGSFQYVVFTRMVSVHNTPGIGCDYVIVKVDWDGDSFMHASLVAHSCYGNAWAVGDTVVPLSEHYPGVNWHLDLKVTAITDEQPVFTPIKS